MNIQQAMGPVPQGPRMVARRDDNAKEIRTWHIANQGLV